jgi:hypothetical protein
MPAPAPLDVVIGAASAGRLAEIRGQRAVVRDGPGWHIAALFTTNQAA